MDLAAGIQLYLLSGFRRKTGGFSVVYNAYDLWFCTEAVRTRKESAGF